MGDNYHDDIILQGRLSVAPTCMWHRQATGLSRRSVSGRQSFILFECGQPQVPVLKDT